MVLKRKEPDFIEGLRPGPVAAGEKPRWRRWSTPTVVVVTGVLLAVALFMPVEMSVSAPGVVVPSARVKQVQHLEGGIVRELYVHEGQTVAQGQRLMQIELGTQGPNLEEIQAKVSSLKAARVRLEAEASGKALSSVVFDKDVPASVARTEQLTYEARLLELKGQLTAARAEVDMYASKAAEVQAKIDGDVARATVLNREYEITKGLAAEKLVSDLEAIQSLKELEANRADLRTSQQAMLTAKASSLEARGKMAETEGRFRRRASEELLTVERQIATATEELSRATEQRDRTLLTAPIAGVVKGLKAVEAGWVAKPGETLLEVVPADAEIELEVRLHPRDRGLVQLNQPVRVKVSAYDFLRFGALNGRVRRIAADADQDVNGEAYFKLVVQTEGSRIGQSQLPVTSGMQADVDVVVGHQQFVWFLLRPVLKVGFEAFREP